MALPIISTPTYTTNLISNNKEVTFRPFLVKEEKVLLLAAESKDNKQMAKAIETILKNCIQNKDVNVQDLPSFDLEYLFIKIRQKSMGESLQVNITCPETNKKFEYSINLEEVKIEKSENFTNKIEINNDIGIVMKYPTFMTSQIILDEESNIKKIFKIIINCIDTIYDKEATYNPRDYTEKELIEFIESLPQLAFEKINKFYETFPKVVYEKEIVSPYTQKEMKVRLDSFMDFFG